MQCDKEWSIPNILNMISKKFPLSTCRKTYYSIAHFADILFYSKFCRNLKKSFICNPSSFYNCTYANTLNRSPHLLSNTKNKTDNYSSTYTFFAAVNINPTTHEFLVKIIFIHQNRCLVKFTFNRG